MNTPWGKSDSKITLKRGFSWVRTPRPGGFVLSPHFAKEHLSWHARVRGSGIGSWHPEKCYRFYGGDCDYAIVAWELLLEHGKKDEVEVEGLGKFNRDTLLKVLSTYHADYLEQRGVTPALDRRYFRICCRGVGS
jgi:hypothetical protein